MSAWTEKQLSSIGDASEIGIATERADGTPRRPVPIWVVRVDDDLNIRSYRGPAGSWFQHVRTRPFGQILCDGTSFAVELHPAPAAAEPIDQAYAAKYGRGGYVKQMTTPAAAATTRRLLPATETN